MTYDPSTTWSDAAAASVQMPVYYLAIDGHTSEHFSTHPVKSAATTKTVCLIPPSGGASKLDPLDGSYSQSPLVVELLDTDDTITDLVSTEAPGASVSTLINRKATLYLGFAHLAEADYAAVYTGRITGLRMNGNRTGYILNLEPMNRQLDAEIMGDATDSEPVTLRGNPVNIYWSILTDTFSTSHATFPLDSVSSHVTGSSAAPTGLGLSTADINESLLVEERDRWYPSDVVEVYYDAPVSAKSHLREEFFRVFQCFPAVSGDGAMGLRFLTPPLPASSATTLTEDHIISVVSWHRLYGDHINWYQYTCETTKGSGTFDTTLYDTQTAEDTADQSASGETIRLDVESLWLSGDYSGDEVATTLAGRTRIRYLKTPAQLTVDVNATRRNVEQGDVVAVTLSDIPNLQTGARGVSGLLMTVVSVAPRADGTIRLVLLDSGYKRFGVVAPSGTSDYTAATDLEKGSFAFVSDGTNETMSNGDPGYRVI